MPQRSPDTLASASTYPRTPANASRRFKTVLAATRWWGTANHRPGGYCLFVLERGTPLSLHHCLEPITTVLSLCAREVVARC